MFLRKVFLLVSTTFYFVSTEYSECSKRNSFMTPTKLLEKNDWFKKNNSDTSKLIGMINCKRSYFDEHDVLFITFEVKEADTLRRFENEADSDYRSIRLRNLKIDEIVPGAFKTITGLATIDLSKNKLKMIKNGIFNNIKGLKYLELNNNEISFIEENAFDNMPDVGFISLSNNKITKLNENWLANSPKVNTVLFNHNQIEKIEANSLKNLRGIRLCMYFNTEIGISLYFHNNKINKIHPDAFKGIPRIYSLILSKNHLTELPSNLFDEVIVEDLDITENNISCIPKKVLNATLTYKNFPICA